MIQIGALVAAVLFTYILCLAEHKRVVRKMRADHYNDLTETYKKGFNKAFMELMPTVRLSDLKMTRETLCMAEAALVAMYGGEEALPHVQRLSDIIFEIDKLRPLGMDGKHGNLHTEYCGCEDK